MSLANGKDKRKDKEERKVKVEVKDQVDAVIAPWVATPWAVDYFALLRRVDSKGTHLPKLGTGLLPIEESVRIGQESSLTFAPAGISQIEMNDTLGRYVIRQRFFGYLGPNSPLPTHMTEFVHLRRVNYSDPTLLGFLDHLNHRFALHFYRAWTHSKPAVSMDRPSDGRYSFQIGSFVGLGAKSRLLRDAVFDNSKLFFTGLLSRQVRNAERIEKVLSGYFGVNVRVEQYAGHWLSIPSNEQTRLQDASSTKGSNVLGRTAVLGTQVWDRQGAIRLQVGAMPLAQFRRFLPNGDSIDALRAWMLQLQGRELAWDAQLILQANQVPASRFGLSQLGWDSWLGTQPRTGDAVDVEISSGDSFS